MAPAAALAAAPAAPTRARPLQRLAGRWTPAALSTVLEEALLDAVLGEPRGPLLARRLERVARAILLRAGFPSARVIVQDTAAGMEVVVLLPPAGPRVRQLVIRLA